MNYSNSQKVGVILYLTAGLFGGYKRNPRRTDKECKYLRYNQDLAKCDGNMTEYDKGIVKRVETCKIKEKVDTRK